MNMSILKQIKIRKSIPYYTPYLERQFLVVNSGPKRIKNPRKYFSVSRKDFISLIEGRKDMIFIDNHERRMYVFDHSIAKRIIEPSSDPNVMEANLEFQIKTLMYKESIAF